MEDQVKHDIHARLKMRTTLIVTHRVEMIRDCRIRSESTTDAFGDYGKREAMKVLAPPDYLMDATRILSPVGVGLRVLA